VLGAALDNITKINKKLPQVLDVVAWLDNKPEKSLAG
jgi:hypothetical protein